jgi:hypothetical protein
MTDCKEISQETIATDRAAIQRKTAALSHFVFPGIDESGMMQVESREPNEPSGDDLSVHSLSNVTVKARLMARGVLQDESREPSGDGARSSVSNIRFKTRSGQVITMKTYKNDQSWIAEGQNIQEDALEESKSDVTHSFINKLSHGDTHSSSSDEASQDTAGSTTVSSGDIHSFITEHQDSTNSTPMSYDDIHSFIREHQDSTKSTTLATVVSDACITNKVRQEPTDVKRSTVSLDKLLDLARDYPWTDDPEACPGEAQLRISIANLRQEAANKEISVAKLRQEEANKEIMKMLEPSQLDSVFLRAPTNMSASVTDEKMPGIGQVDETFEDEEPYYDQLPKRLRRPRAPPFCLASLLLITGTIAFGIWYIIHSKNLSEDLGQCSLCHDGSIPDNLYRNMIGFQTCYEFQKDQVQLEASDPLCTNAQVLTWRYCECPTLPPLEHSRSSCQLCPDGSPPESQFCEDYMAFLVHMYEVDYSCDAIISAAVKGGCTCPQTQAPADASDPEVEEDEEGPEEASGLVIWEKKPGQPCSFCYDGSIPEDLLSTEVGGQTCADYLFDVEALDASSEDCARGQALAWLMCGCPSLPPPPEHPTCTLCGEGVPLVNQACDEINTFMAHTSDPVACTDLAKSVFDVGCTCPLAP